MNIESQFPHASCESGPGERVKGKAYILREGCAENFVVDDLNDTKAEGNIRDEILQRSL